MRYLLALVLILAGCGGGGDSVIAQDTRSGSQSITVPDGGDHIYEVLAVQADIGAPVNISARFDIATGGQAWAQLAEDDVAIVGSMQAASNGSASVSLHGYITRTGSHRYSLRVVVSGAAGTLQVSNPSITITR